MNSRALFLILLAFASFVLTAADWPQWRGLNRDGIVVGEKPLAGLPASTKAVWSIECGKGQGGLVLANGRLLMLHETEEGDKKMETAALLNAANGKAIWETSFAESWQYRNVYGSGPRVAPQIDGDLVFVQGVKGVLACLNLTDGKLLWSKNYEKDFGAKWFGGNAPGSGGTAASRHGNNGAPVTDARHVYAPVGSHLGASLVCLEKRTGKIVWKTGKDYAAYSGLMLAKLADVEQVVMLTAGRMIGYATKDGRELWSVDARSGAARNIVTPIIHGDTVTVASHTFGTFQVKIRNTGEGQAADETWRNRDVRTNITTPVLVDGHLYGLGTSRGRNSEFVCINHKTGKVAWSQEGFSDYVSVIGIGKRLLLHCSDGSLVLIEATSEKYKEVGRLKASGRSWNFPVYSGGILYVKDDAKLAALKLQ